MNIQQENSEVPMSMDLERGQKTQCQVCSFDMHKNLHDLSSSMTMSGEASHEQLNDGDYDSSIQKTQVVGSEPHKKIINADTFATIDGCQLVIFSKNVRGLTGDIQFSMILAELDHVEWDVLILCETWRHEAQEIFQVCGNHTFFGSAGIPGKRGVGFLVHARHRTSLRDFESLNERICSLTLRLGKTIVRLIAVYFPHSGYPDDDVQAMYSQMSEIHLRARRKKQVCIIAGDFNASVGQQQIEDHPTTVGRHGFGEENARGHWMKQWCNLENMCIANTMFPKPNTKKVTHTSDPLETYVR